MKRVDIWPSSGPFNSILKSWVSYIRAFTNHETIQDIPYWYGELASVSTLATSIAKLSKTYLLWEYASKKGRTKAQKDGFVDLWFVYRNKEYLVEAKQIYPEIPLLKDGKLKKNRILNKVKIAMDKSIADAKKSYSGWKPNIQRGVTPLGVTFIVPYLSLRNFRETELNKKDLNLRIKKFYHYLFVEQENEIFKNVLAYAYIFPGLNRVDDFRDENYDYYPGVILLISEVSI